jgi:hypothetical protein
MTYIIEKSDLRQTQRPLPEQRTRTPNSSPGHLILPTQSLSLVHNTVM